MVMVCIIMPRLFSFVLVVVVHSTVSCLCEWTFEVCGTFDWLGSSSHIHLHFSWKQEYNELSECSNWLGSHVRRERERRVGGRGWGREGESIEGEKGKRENEREGGRGRKRKKWLDVVSIMQVSSFCNPEEQEMAPVSPVLLQPHFQGGRNALEEADKENARYNVQVT